MDLAPSYLEKAATDALGRGNSAEAEDLLRQALSKDLNDYRCIVMIAHLLREKGDAMESAAFAERGVQLQPNLVEAYFQLGLSLLELGRAEPAAKALGKAVALRPEIAEFHACLASAYQMMGRKHQALMSFERSSKLQPEDLRLRISLATRLLAEDDVFGAASHMQAALATDPDSVPANLTMAEIAMVDGKGDVAEAHIRKALDNDQENPFGLALLGLRLTHRGDYQGAEIALRKSLALNPNQGFSYWELIQIGKIEPGQVARMERVRDQGRLEEQELSSLLFALGKSYENLGDYERAMAAYDDANKAAFTARYGSGEYNHEATKSAREDVLDLFPAGREGLANDSDRPIFIVGMIRSGTTLMEQILSRHPDVGGAGELKFWQLHARSAKLTSGILADPARAKQLTETYLEDLQAISPNTRHVIDKMPGNYARLGLLSELFPNAKFIHCVRRPIDNAISIHTTPNREPSVSKVGVVLDFRLYQETMNRWREVLPPGRILDVQYEDLVFEPEPIIRKVLSFCNLEWDGACLRPETNTKEILTPSVWQARQPIYKTSVDRWRRFEPWLGELRELLDVN